MRLNPYSNGMKIERIMTLCRAHATSLNPYSNGMKIERTCLSGQKSMVMCLNPYSNGMKIELYDDGDVKVEFPMS